MECYAQPWYSKEIEQMTKACTERSLNQVRVSDDVWSDWSAFTVDSGVKQGDGLSPLLFNITLESVI